jgi:hypothetical protein
VLEVANDLEEERQRAEWERIRWLAAILLSPHTAKGKTIKPDDLIVFPWEKPAPKIDPEKQARLDQIGDKWDEEIKKRYGVS